GVDFFAEKDARAPADSAKNDAETGLPAETDERLVPNGFNAHHEVANKAADECTAENQLIRTGGILIAEDAEKHPAQQAAQAAENRLKIYPYQQIHGSDASFGANFRYEPIYWF